jgi:hypothetical protein
MALDRERDFVDVEDEADSRRAARRVSFIGVLTIFVLGFALILLLTYGRILTDSSVAELTGPPAVTVPKAETPVTPAARSANSPQQ